MAQDNKDYDLFLRRYEARIVDTASLDVDDCYQIYKEKGEDVFLDKLEEAETYNDFCRKYYSILREAYNICSAGMYDSYQHYKEKFNCDDTLYREYLRRTIKNFDKYHGTANFY